MSLLLQMNTIKIAVLWLSLLIIVKNLSNGLALTPPMIFFPKGPVSCKTNESYVLNQAQILIEKGLNAKGFNYVLIESCWQGQRDKSGILKEDLTLFPSGMRQLVSQLHSRGLNVGLTIDLGDKTACGKSGSLNNQKSDANLLAYWGVDYVVFENSQNISSFRPRSSIMSSFIMETGRRIMISLNNDGKESVVNWGAQVANTWKTNSKLNPTWESLTNAINNQIGLQIYSGSGGWNDADNLLSTLPINQFSLQFCMWICLKSPITIQSPLQTLTEDKKKLFFNSQMLALHKDSLKQSGKLIRRQNFANGWQQIWGCKLSANRYLLVFLNGLNVVSKMEVSLKTQLNLSITAYWVRDPLNQITLGSSTNEILKVDKIAAHAAEVRIVNL